jgi:hypothetical protein
MTTIPRRLLLWSPRILGILVSLFIGLFALDAFSQGKAFVLLALVGASWRREWIGGVAFIGLAVLYAMTTAKNHLDWMLLISGPLVIVGTLFMWSWLRHAELHAS